LNSNSNIGDEGMVGIIQPLGGGGCPKLKVMMVSEVGMEGGGVVRHWFQLCLRVISGG